MQHESTITKASAATTAPIKELYRLETSLPLAGKNDNLPLKEWKRIYGYDNDSLAFNGAKLIRCEAAN